MDDEWVYPLAKTLPSLVNNLWWNIVMDDWNLDENHLVSDNNWNIVNLWSPNIYKEWEIMLGLHLVLVTLYHGLQLVLSKTIQNGDIKNHI